MKKQLFFATLIFCLACQSKTNSTKTRTFFIGTYTQKEGHVDGKGDGIYKMTFDPKTLDLKITDTIKSMTNPSFLALSNDNFRLFAVNEISPGTPDYGKLEVYGITSADFGKTEKYGIGSADFGQKLAAASTESYASCHVILDKNERVAIVSNYLGGVSVFQLPLKNDSKPQILQFPKVAKASPRQENSHPHSAIFSPDGQRVYIADLGTDRIMQFQFDAAQQKLVPAATPFFELPDGCGPRHLAFSNDGKTLFVLCELSNEVAVLVSPEARLENGNLKKNQIIGTLPADFKGSSDGADIHISKNGQFLYASNRGHNSIAVFKINENGSLETIGHVDCHGKIPRNFHLTSDGNWMLVANQNSDNIALFDLQKGELPVFVKNVEVKTPVSIVEIK